MRLETWVEDDARGLRRSALDFRNQLALVVIAGAEDAETTPAGAGTIAQRIRGARLAVCRARAAHLANVEQASAFTEAVIEHLQPRSSPP
jgi:3-oxoadipate enol-lactonase